MGRCKKTGLFAVVVFILIGAPVVDMAASDSGIVTALNAPLENVQLSLGKNLKIGNSLESGTRAVEDCFEKKSWQSVFCIEAIDWDNDISALFSVRSGAYNGQKSIVRYRDKKVTDVYLLFQQNNFIDVLKWIQKKYGPPTERQIRWVQVMAAPKIANSVYRWKTIDKNGDAQDVLEIRSIDDLRQTFPDLRFGALRLHRSGAPSMFNVISMTDLLVLNKRRLSQ